MDQVPWGVIARGAEEVDEMTINDDTSLTIDHAVLTGFAVQLYNRFAQETGLEGLDAFLSWLVERAARREDAKHG